MMTNLEICLRRSRRRRNPEDRWNTNRLSDATGLPRTSVSKWVSGARPLLQGTAEKMAAVLGVSATWLTQDAQEMVPAS